MKDRKDFVPLTPEEVLDEITNFPLLMDEAPLPMDEAPLPMDEAPLPMDEAPLPEDEAPHPLDEVEEDESRDDIPVSKSNIAY